MRFHKSLTRAAILSASVLTLAGCDTLSGKLSVDLEALKECQRLDRKMAVPSIEEDSDYRELSAEALAEIAKGNRAQADRTKCENGVIEKYKNAT